MIAKRKRVVRVLSVLPFALLLVVSLSAPPAKSFPQDTNFNDALQVPGYGPFALGDFNNDTLLDLAAISDIDNAVYVYGHVYYQNGMVWQPIQQISLLFPIALASDDVTSDHLADLVILTVDSVYVYQQANGELNFTVSLPANSSTDLALADFDSDGNCDLILTGPFGTTVYFQIPHNETHFDVGNSMSFPDMAASSVATGYLNDDEMVDLATASSFQIKTYIQTAPGVFNETSIVDLQPWSYDPTTLTLGDMNNDGSTDMAIVSPYVNPTSLGHLQILYNINSSFAKNNGIHMLGNFTGSILVEELNDDGLNDLLLAGLDGKTILISFTSEGLEDFEPFLVANHSTGKMLFAAGNLNGDSFTDVAIRVDDFILFYYRDNLPVTQIREIPSTYYLKDDRQVRHLIDLNDYFSDDHGVILYEVTYEEDSSSLDAYVEEHYLSFRPAPGWYGPLSFKVGAWDGYLPNAWVESNVFQVWVNDVPKIISTPVTEVELGSNYSYTVEAEDNYPLDDTLRYYLLQGPEGMTIDLATGRIDWSPKEAGSKNIEITVEDNFGCSDTQSFTLTVSQPVVQPPSPPSTQIYIIGGGVAVSVTSILLAIAISENIKYALLIFFIPLYSKIKRERVLDHFIRGQIYGYILANPGEHYNAIKQALGLTNGSLAHHLKTLEREEYIKSKKFGLYRRFYPRHMRLPDDGTFRMNEIQKQILSIISKKPGISQKEIASFMNITPPTVSYHIGILSNAKIIRVIRNGRKTQCYAEKT